MNCVKSMGFLLSGFLSFNLLGAAEDTTVQGLQVLFKKEQLLKEDVDLQAFKRGTVDTFRYGFMLYLMGAVVSLFSPWIAFAIYFFIPVYFIFPRATVGK